MKSTFTFLLGLLFLQPTFSQTISDIIEKSLPAVVTIAIYKTQDDKPLLGFKGQPSDVAYEKALDITGAEGSGSGFVIEKSGKKYVITNAHVVDNASAMRGSLYAFSINQKKYEMKVVGGDIIFDIAVLEFVTPPGAEFGVLAFETVEPRIGETVYAIGNPLAEFPYSVVDGIISAKNRTTKTGSVFQGKFGYIQTTATLIWGNSGGPLINTKGNVIGINSQLYAKQVGNTSVITPQINFALEAKTAVRLINDIISTGGNVIRAFIGVEISIKFRHNPKSYYNTQEGFTQEDSIPVLSAVVSGSPAANYLSGKTGWQILKINNKPVRNTEEVLQEFESIRPSQTITFTLTNSARTENISFTVQKLDAQKSKMIALHIFENKQGIRINESYGKVWVTMDQEKEYRKSQEYSLQSRKSDYYEKQNEPALQKGEWQIVSAGINKADDKNMWLITSLADLGIVARIMGNRGYLDLLLQKNGYYSDNLSEGYLYFSEDSDIIQQTIWY